MPDITTVILSSALAAVTTGLGVVPLIFSKSIPARFMSLASALVGGLLLAATFQLIGEGMADGAATTISGIVAGLVLITASRKWLEGHASPDIGLAAESKLTTLINEIASLGRRAGKHSKQRPIPQYPVMDKRSSRMKARQSQQAVCEQLVHFLQAVCERAICGPR